MDSFGSGYLSLHSILVQIYVPLITTFPPCNLQSNIYISSALCAHNFITKSICITNFINLIVINRDFHLSILFNYLIFIF